MSQQPNILLIIVDDMGYADFEPFGYSDQQVSVPNITSLAQEGMVFSQAYTTAPVCSPSRCGIHTGKFQFRWDEKAGWNPGLPDSVKTLAEYLHEAGYTTARIGKTDYGSNFHKIDVREHPLNHGFDYFLGFNAHAHDYWLMSEDMAKRTPDPNGASAHLGPLMHNRGYKSFEKGYLTDIFTDDAIRFLEKERDNPFFLEIAYNAVHMLIHEVPQKYLDKYDVKPIPNYDPDRQEAFEEQKPGSYVAYYNKYAQRGIGVVSDEDMRKFQLANLNCLDDNIGRVLDALHTNDLDKETMVIFVSDNGGSHHTLANNFPLTAGKYTLWEGGIRVPMAVKWPGIIKPGSIQNKYVSAADILPTLADAAGIILSDPRMDGISLLKPDNNRLLVWRWKQYWAVRKGDFKLTNEQTYLQDQSFLYVVPAVNDNTLKLFNVDKDPGERNNLAGEMPEKVKELKKEYDTWLKENTGKY